MLKTEFVIGLVKKVTNEHILLKKLDGLNICIDILDKKNINNYFSISQNKFSNLNIGVSDILMIERAGKIRTLFKNSSNDNVLFITNMCNSNCLMCSQPPRIKNDIEYFYQINNAILDLLPKNTEVIGVSGGEPTLIGNKLNKLLKRLKEEFPKTNVQVLSNGRKFNNRKYVASLALDISKNTLFGVPLYSHIPSEHDYIVQSRNSFYQTANGLHNAARYGLRIEIRIVINKLNYKILPELAKYIYMNFPFVEHVAFMGLEYTGHTLINSQLLKVNPKIFSKEIKEAVIFLHSSKINCSIYNLPLCLLDRELWNFTSKSISDWKRDYLEDCLACSVRKGTRCRPSATGS